MINHFIVTRYCIRDLEVFAGGGKFLGTAGDPLQKSYLEKRLIMIQGVAYPSLLGQTNRNFEWVFLVDRDLPESYRQRLKGITRGKIKTHIVEYIEESKMQYLHWLNLMIDPDKPYVVTTNLDDDDALSKNYIEALQNNIIQLHHNSSLPPFKFFGCSKAYQWSLIHTDRVRYGWKSDATFRWPYSSVGMSIMVEHPKINMACPGINHCAMHLYGQRDESKEEKIKGLKLMNDELEKQLKRIDKKLEDYTGDQMILDLKQSAAQVLITNHNFNDAISRKKRPHENLELVEGPESFIAFQLNFDFIVKNLTSIKQNNLKFYFAKSFDKIGKALKRIKRKVKRLLKFKFIFL